MSNVDIYNNYFRQLAVKHRQLKHDPAGESGDCKPGSMRFSTISVDAIFASLQNKIGYPCMTLELYDTETNSETVNHVRQRPKGAFMVVDKPKNDLLASKQAAYARCETVVYQLLQKIWSNHYAPGVDRKTTVFKFFDVDKLEITPVGPIFGDCYGYRCEFSFEFQNTVNIASAPPADAFDD